MKTIFCLLVLLIFRHASNSQDLVMYFVPNIYKGIDTFKTLGDHNIKNKTISVLADSDLISSLNIRIADNDNRVLEEGKYKLCKIDTVYRIIVDIHGETTKKVKWVNLVFKREGYWSQVRKGKMVSSYYSEGEKIRVKGN